MVSIKQQMLSGVFYTAVAKYSSIIISLIVMAVLARLLHPDDFGVIAVATVIINFFNIFTNIGFSSAIIQNKELTSRDINNIYMFTIWLGILLSILFFLSAWSIASYYNDERLISICQLLSISLFFSAIAIVPNTLFYKNKKFKFIAYRTFLIQLIIGIFSIIAALSGVGLYTLIIQPILSSILIFCVSLKKYPQKIQWVIGIKSVKKIWNYSIYQFLFNVVNYFTRNLDKRLIGKYMGMNPLGYYEKSYRLMMLPLQNITYVITPVMHPILSDYQNDMKKLAYSHERITRLLAFIGFPLSLALFFCSEELVLCIFGNQWLPSIPVFKILSLTVGIQLVLSSSGPFYQAGNDTRGLLICGIFSAMVSVCAILIGIFYFDSLEATAWCILIAFCLNFIQCYWQLYHFMFRRNLSFFYHQLISPITLSFIIGCILYFTSLLIGECNLIMSLSLKSILSLLIWGIYIQFTQEYDIASKIKNILLKSNK